MRGRARGGLEESTALCLPAPGHPGSHLLPVCTVVTVVGLGLRSPPTAETPEEADETKLQRVDGDIQSFRVVASGSGVARLSVPETLALVLSRLLPRCNRRMCRTTAVALNACLHLLFAKFFRI